MPGPGCPVCGLHAVQPWAGTQARTGVAALWEEGVCTRDVVSGARSGLRGVTSGCAVALRDSFAVGNGCGSAPVVCFGLVRGCVVVRVGLEDGGGEVVEAGSVGLFCEVGVRDYGMGLRVAHQRARYGAGMLLIWP